MCIEIYSCVIIIVKGWLEYETTLQEPHFIMFASNMMHIFYTDFLDDCLITSIVESHTFKYYKHIFFLNTTCKI